jgi:hypothetical protein
VVWTFRDVALDDGGSVSGHFTFTPELSPHVTDWSVWVTGGDTTTFPVFEYRPDNSGLGEGSGGEIEFAVPGTSRQIVFRRSVPLTGTVYVPLDLSSANDTAYESYGGATPKRLIQAGALFSDPTPTRVRWFFDLVLADGGTVSGYADHSPGDTTVLKWAVSVKGGDAVTFPPLVYLPANSDPDYALLDSGRYLHFLSVKPPPLTDARVLRYAGRAPMGADGGRIALDTDNSVECYNCGVYRQFSGGTLRGVTDETWGDGFE